MSIKTEELKNIRIKMFEQAERKRNKVKEIELERLKEQIKRTNKKLREMIK